MNRNHDYLLKHKSYIDNRLKIISEEISVSRGDGNIKEIMNLFLIDGYDYIEINLSAEWITALTELKSLADGWNIFSDGDILGYVYVELQNKSAKNKKGQYFTPPYIVDHIVNEAMSDYHEGGRILDPACGSGQFLISVVKNICARLEKKPSSEEVRAAVKNSIYGFDTDPCAAAIAKKNLAMLTGLSSEEINIFQKDFLFRDDMSFDSFKSAKYDLIIGNPPWGSKFSDEEKKYFRRSYECASTGINSFSLFIERAFDFLKETGRAAFLLPEAMLNIRAHRRARELILKGSAVEIIIPWGEMFKGVFAPSVSVMFKREFDVEMISRNIVRVKSHHDNFSSETLVPQESFRRAHESIFNIKYSKRAVNIISSIESADCVYLKDRAKFFLGVVTGNNNRFISDRQSNDFPDPILTGQDISQYKINFSGNYFKFDPAKLQQVAPKELYLSDMKIVYKFIGRRLSFAYDRSSSFMLNNVNGFIPDMGSEPPELMLSVLNSRVIQYYYEKNFFTVKVLRGNIERLPLKIISKGSAGHLVSLVREIIYSDDDMPAAREKIEDIICYEYGISDREAGIIMDAD